jgi:MSHA biogenesis protein MshG
MSQLSFHYRALDPCGAPTRGVLRARSREEAYRQIVAAGLKPLRIVGGRATAARGRRRVTLRDLSQFTYQFAVLMEARIPIVDGLRSIVEQEPKERFREIVEDVAAQIEAGHSVTEALSPHREVFGETYVETVRTAERSGNMIDVLSRLAEMLDQQYEMRKNVKGALMYPLCVIGALALAVTFLMTFVIPRFAEMFASRGIELPLPTQFVIAVSGLLRTYWYLFLGGSIGAIWAVRRAWHDPSSRRRIDTLLHRLPFMRDILQGVALSRFTNVLGIALRSGLSLIDALELGGRASGRPLLQSDAEKLGEQINRGGRLSDAVMNCEYVPAFARRMLAAGEEAGELPRMCEIVARNYDREVVHLTRNVTAVIEPIMIVGLAAIVLLIALAIFLPMWNMAALIG